MNEFNKFFIRILEIVDYQEDKEKFSQEFYKAILTHVFQNLIASLTDEKQQILIKQIENIHSDQIDQTISDYFNQEQIDEELKKVTIVLVDLYLEELKPSLSETQVQQLLDYLKFFSKKS